MTKAQADYTVIPFPRMRQVYIDTLHLAHQKHLVHGLIEVDVTAARQFIREHRARTGETLSFTGFVATCVGKAVDMNKHMHAYRNWRNQLVLFDDVDVTTMFEIEVGDKKTPLAHIIRAANKRSFREIHDEIRAVQAVRAREKRNPHERYLRLYVLAPAFIRRFLWKVLLKNPHWVKRYTGTVGLTAVGMFGEGGGWGLTEPVYTLGLTLGGIAEKPGVVGGRLEIREVLSVTLTFDHDIVDGAPAARFAQRLKDLIESAYGLIEQPG